MLIYFNVNILYIIMVCFSTVQSHESNNRFSKYIHIKKPETSSSCFEELGCLSTTEEWYHDTYRPYNLEPLDRHTIKTQFISITRNCTNQKDSILQYNIISVKNASITEQSLGYKKNITILIHDFTSNGYTGWIKHIADVILEKADLNLLSVDWQAGAEPPFQQAVSNARVVALEVAYFLKVLQYKSSSTIHIIGHGVGAHIAGYVGHATNITRITGLDPTGPYFEHMPPIVRLDSEDAKFVEVLHTDAFNVRSQGSKTSMGHYDFYINGANLQPQCTVSNEYPPFTKLDRNSLREGVILPACSHKRSFKYFIESLGNTDCEFIGFNCNNYKRFIEGKCTACDSSAHSSCTTFGGTSPKFSLNLKNDNYNFYLNTYGTSPFCLNAYRVKMMFDSVSGSKSTRSGNFEMIMIDKKGIMITAHPTNTGSQFTFKMDKSYEFIYYAPPPLITDVVEVKLRWVHNPNSFCVLCNKAVYIKSLHIKNIFFSKNISSMSKMCSPIANSEILNGSYKTCRCKEKNKR